MGDVSKSEFDKSHLDTQVYLNRVPSSERLRDRFQGNPPRAQLHLRGRVEKNQKAEAARVVSEL
jgi:hypothetical protein